MPSGRFPFEQQEAQNDGTCYVALAADDEVETEGSTVAEPSETEVLTKDDNFLDELWTQIKLAVPLCCANLIAFLVPIASVAFIGHLGPEELASAALATSFSNVTLISVMIGLSTALDTLCTQAFGAKNFVQMGYACQRTFLIQLVILVPLAVLNWEVEAVLLLAGQAPNLAAKAAPYSRLLIVSGLIMAGSANVRRFLMAQRIVKPVLYSAVLGCVCHLLVCWTLTRYVGYLGAPMAVILTALIQGGYLFFQAARSPAAEEFPGLTAECLRDWGPVLALALPSLAMNSIEWWSAEFITLLAGRLAEPALKVDAAIVCFSTIQLAYAVPFGLGGAVAIRVGNELGAGYPMRARQAGRAVVILACCAALMSSLVTYLGADVIGFIFMGSGANNTEARAIVSSTLPVVALVLIFANIQVAVGGVIRGSGKQTIGMGINFTSYFVLAVPLGAILAFHFNFDIHGLWYGFLTGSCFQAASYIFILSFMNWSKLADEAATRLEQNMQRSRASQERLRLAESREDSVA